MHRVITDCPDGMVVDHINDDALDNRRSNLRVCTQQDNIRNGIKCRRRLGKRTRSKYKGAHFHGPTGRWQARIVVSGRQISLGYFDHEIDAAKAYDEAAYEMFGEFARPNIL